MGFSFAVVFLFVFEGFGGRGDGPASAVLAVEFFAGLFAQLVSWDVADHGNHLLCVSGVDHGVSLAV